MTACIQMFKKSQSIECLWNMSITKEETKEALLTLQETRADGLAKHISERGLLGVACADLPPSTSFYSPASADSIHLFQSVHLWASVLTRDIVRMCEAEPEKVVEVSSGHQNVGCTIKMPHERGSSGFVGIWDFFLTTVVFQPQASW